VLGGYYRTYPQTVESEVKAALASRGDFLKGPFGMKRDSPETVGEGFTVRDGNYLSARWPGDCHTFSARFVELLAERAPRSITA
jgi:protease I